MHTIHVGVLQRSRSGVDNLMLHRCAATVWPTFFFTSIFFLFLLPLTLTQLLQCTGQVDASSHKTHAVWAADVDALLAWSRTC